MISGTKKPQLRGFFANSLTFGISAVKLCIVRYRSDITLNKSPAQDRKARRYVHSCGCSIVKSKAIGSTWSRFTPTEPNWTDKPAVINYGDIQHLSGMEPKKRGVILSLINRKRV